MSSVQHYSLTRLTVPAPAVSIDEARSYIRIRHNRDDDLIQLALDAALEDHEAQTGRQLMKAQYRLDLDSFPSIIRLKKPPLIDVVTFQYIATDGSPKTLVKDTDYQLDSGSPDTEARLLPAYGKFWPTARTQLNAVSITYDAGYGTDPKVIPSRDRLRILANTELLFKNSSGMTSERSPKSVRMALQQLAWQRRVISA